MTGRDNFQEFWLSVPRFYTQALLQTNSFDLNVVEFYQRRCDEYVGTLSVFMNKSWELSNHPDNNGDHELSNLVESLLNLVVNFISLREKLQGQTDTIQTSLSETNTNVTVLSSMASRINFEPNQNAQSGHNLGRPKPTPLHTPQPESESSNTEMNERHVGRPSVDIEPSHVRNLRSLGYNWCTIARILNVSERTLRSRRQQFNFQELDLEYSNITDDELDQILISVQQLTPNSGESYMMGALRSRGIRVRRQDIRDSLNRIDPVARALRRRRVTYRRKYFVPHANFIWHIDGHHKLIDPWGFVFHGAVDGFSRLCVYLRCTFSNKATVVRSLFEYAVQRYGYPLRLRCDYGGENIDVARIMLLKRGIKRGSVITGLSVHNQRIERLWREVHVQVVSGFRELFTYMETAELANPYNPVHVNAMRYVYTPRINVTVNEFIQQWNNHSVRTMRHRSPNSVWYESMHLNQSDSENVSDWYDIDEDGPTPELQTVNNVQVPEVNIGLNEELLDLLSHHVDPLQDDGVRGISLFLKTVSFLNEHCQDNLLEH